MLILPATQLLNPEGYLHEEFSFYSIYTLEGLVIDLFMYGSKPPALEIRYEDGRLENPVPVDTVCLLSEYEVFQPEVEYHLRNPRLSITSLTGLMSN